MTQLGNAIFRELEKINLRLTNIETVQRKIEIEIRRPRDNSRGLKEEVGNATSIT